MSVEVVMDRGFGPVTAEYQPDSPGNSASGQGDADADLDCKGAARLLMRMQADLVLFLDMRERLQRPIAKRA